MGFLKAESSEPCQARKHKKGGKQYRQEKKCRLSKDENPASSKKAKKDKQGTEVLQAPVAKQEEPEKEEEERVQQ